MNRKANQTVKYHPPDQPMKGDMIGKAELARRLGKSERTIERWQRSGVISCSRLGGSVYYNWNDIFKTLKPNARKFQTKRQTR